MNHETCRERLLDLAYGELSRREAVEVERHLAQCEPCRLERDGMASTLGAMRRLEPPPAPERGDGVVLAAARQAAEERRSNSFGLALRGFGIRVAAGTAFAVLAVLLLVNVRQGLRSPAEDVARERAAARSRAEPTVGPPPSAAEAPSLVPAPSEPEARPQAKASRREHDQPAPATKKSTARRDERAAPPERASREPQVAAPAAPSSSLPRRAETGGEERNELPAVQEGRAGKVPVAPPGGLSEGLPPGAVGDERAEQREERKAAPIEPETFALRRGKAASGAADQLRPQAAAPAAPGSGARAAASGAQQDRAVQRLRASPVPASAWAREVERRRAAGELSEAQKRFEPCPGGDVRRTAFIDGEQRILKLVHERGDGFVIEEWFDESGRLREALVRGRAAGRAWSRHISVGANGEEASQDVSESGLAPETPPPQVVRRDPSRAFFSGPGCAP